MGDLRECVISEILCYFQGKMNTMEHDFIVKAVTTYYSESDIGIAKKLLFDKCCDTKIRYRTYHNDKAMHDCQDIINKMNEVGEGSPMFVAADVNNLPLATVDAFDLNSMSKKLSTLLNLETDVKAAFASLSCLQNDFLEMFNKCSGIGSMKTDIAAIQLKLSEQSKADVPEAGAPEVDTPEVDTPEVDTPEVASSEADITQAQINFDKDSDTNSSTDAGNSSYDGDDEYYTEFPKMLSNQMDARIPPKKWLTDGGFQFVKDKSAHKPALAVKSTPRVFVNSGRRTLDSRKYSLKSVKPMSHDSIGDSSKFDVFVSRLDPATKPRDVAQYLKHVHGKQFKVTQVRNKYPGYVSFKVNAQSRKLMSALLNKDNWDAGVFVKEFNTKSRTKK